MFESIMEAMYHIGTNLKKAQQVGVETEKGQEALEEVRKYAEALPDDQRAAYKGIVAVYANPDSELEARVLPDLEGCLSVLGDEECVTLCAPLVQKARENSQAKELLTEVISDRKIKISERNIAELQKETVFPGARSNPRTAFSLSKLQYEG